MDGWGLSIWKRSAVVVKFVAGYGSRDASGRERSADKVVQYVGLLVYSSSVDVEKMPGCMRVDVLFASSCLALRHQTVCLTANSKPSGDPGKIPPQLGDVYPLPLSAVCDARLMFPARSLSEEQDLG